MFPTAAFITGDPTAEDWIPINSPVPGNLEAAGNSKVEQNNRALKVELPNPGTNVQLHHKTAVSATRDAETGAVVHFPPGGECRAVVVYEDGLTVTRHADGTVQRWWQGKERTGTGMAGLVLVECLGFASVEVRAVDKQNKTIRIFEITMSIKEPECCYVVVGVA